jgi:hypothetical protein
VLLYLRTDVLTQKGAEPGTPKFQVAIRSARRAVTLRPTLGAAATAFYYSRLIHHQASRDAIGSGA